MRQNAMYAQCDNVMAILSDCPTVWCRYCV